MAWTGWQDQSVVIYCGWSDKGFHVALDVTDDSIHPYDRNQERWRGDCLLLAFDLAGNRGTTPRQDDLLLTLALTVPQPPDPLDPEGGEGEDPEDPPADDDPGGEFQVHRKPDDSGVIYEVTIPWDTFREHRRRDGPVPRSGMTFGMNLVLTDDDNGRSSTSYMSLSPGQKLSERTQQVWDLFVPDYFPRIRLER